jgi:type IV secretory pathway VirB10-like protein
MTRFPGVIALLCLAVILLAFAGCKKNATEQPEASPTGQTRRSPPPTDAAPVNAAQPDAAQPAAAKPNTASPAAGDSAAIPAVPPSIDMDKIPEKDQEFIKKRFERRGTGGGGDVPKPGGSF